MNPQEYKVYNETRIRNLKRKLAKISQHPDLVDEYLEIQNQIKQLEE